MAREEDKKRGKKKKKNVKEDSEALLFQALAVIEYLVAHGSERAVDDIVEHTFQISVSIFLVLCQTYTSSCLSTSWFLNTFLLHHD